MKSGNVRRSLGADTVGITSVVFVAAIVLMAPGALGTDHPVGATGSTYIDQYGCDATVNANLPIYLNVSNGDSVSVYYNYTYDDERRPGSSLAGHAFSQVVQYGGGGWAESHGYNTTGDTQGGGGIQKTVYNVQENTSIRVEWYANITFACSDGASAKGYIYLY